MKINQVEELVGITKKNIRFYEEQGLLNPERNPENGYREYSLKDVAQLCKIKLFRKLDVPIEEIKKMQAGQLSFDKCMEEHMVRLNHQQHNLELVKELCSKMMDEVDEIEKLDAAKYLEEMARLELGGTTFMNITENDVRKKKVGPLIATLVVVLVCAAGMGVLLWANSLEPIPPAVLLVILAPMVVVTLGVIAALVLRIKEINGGEEDEASKY